jgi:hypothetical protein
MNFLVYQNACALFAPTTTMRAKAHKLAWCNDGRSALRLKKKWWFRLRASGQRNPEIVKRYKQARKRVKKLINENIIDYEQALIKDAKQNPKLFFKYINSKRQVKSFVRALKSKSGDVITDKHAF